MRTTVSIDDHLLQAAKKQARRRGLTLGQLIEEGLRRELSPRRSRAPAPSIPTFRGGHGPRPGVDLTSTRGLLEALDEGQRPDHLR